MASLLLSCCGTDAQRLAFRHAQPKEAHSPSAGWNIDHALKRRERETKEVVSTAKRVGLGEAAVRKALGELEALLPELYPNLVRSKAALRGTSCRVHRRVASAAFHAVLAHLQRCRSQHPQHTQAPPAAIVPIWLTGVC